MEDLTRARARSKRTQPPRNAVAYRLGGARFGARARCKRGRSRVQIAAETQRMSIELQATAPDFTLLDTKREPVTLSSFQGKQVVVLAFFPAAFTGVCETELCTFRDALVDFNGLDATVLGICVDAP